MNFNKYISPIGAFQNDNGVLLSKVLAGANNMYESIDSKIQLRIEAELSIINQKQATWYFLLMADIVQFSNDNNIWLGPGRGSAAGSIVNYCLGITKIDPLAYGLIFERFYNKDNIGLPDIDLDVEIGGREKIITYLKHQFGQQNIVEIKNENGGKHAATIAISNNPLIESLTIDKALEIDCLTIDLLSWNILTELKNEISEFEKQTGQSLSLNQIYLNDPKTLKIFHQGNTKGILYFDAKSMQDILTNYNPENFNDLVVLFALFRTSMVDQITKLIALKQGDLLKLVPNDIRHIVAESYGLIVYQEQIMQIVNQVASFSMEQADALRKALGKKQQDKILNFKNLFFNMGVTNGHSEYKLTPIWKEIEEAGAKVFNKSHSICYTKIAFQLAYIKAHFPNGL